MRKSTVIVALAAAFQVFAGTVAHAVQEDPEIAADDRPGYVSDMGELPATSETDTEAVSLLSSDEDPEITGDDRPGYVSDMGGLPATSETDTEAVSLPAGQLNSAASSPSPSACRGRSNDPHQSTSTPTWGDMKGFSKTWCQQMVPFIEVEAWIWRERWWGYQKMGVRGYDAEGWDFSVGRSGWWDGCDSNSWRTVGRHHVQDLDARHYYLETQKYEDINCW